MSSKGRPKSPEKRDQILAAAGALFPLQGVANTSMAAIAEAAGVSKQTVYSHFDCKSTLFRAAVTHRVDEHQLTADFFAQSRPVEELLLDLARHLMELLLAEDALQLHRLCISQCISHPEISQQFFEAGPEAVRQLLENYLSQCCEKKLLQIADTQIAAVQLLSMITGGAHERALMGVAIGSKAELDLYLRETVTMFIRAYQSEK
ncbi:MAG: TetR/AcrR family transcriptional regulator C-terminal domain-containing protein [Pseudomonadales bacterium]